MTDTRQCRQRSSGPGPAGPGGAGGPGAAGRAGQADRHVRRARPPATPPATAACRSAGPPPLPAQRPYGSYFDELADALGTALEQSGSSFGDAVERVVDRVRRADLLRAPRAAARRSPPGCATSPTLAFELCLGVSGVHYPADTGRRAARGLPPDVDPAQPPAAAGGQRARRRPARPLADRTCIPTCDWHERETWDFFGIVFDGHPALTRIEMPDDWKGHPQRKDYPLGGIPVEYRGATIPPPDERRATNDRSDRSRLRRHRGRRRPRKAASTPSAARTGTRSSRRPGTTSRNGDEQLVVNMGPQHPSTHGVLRLVLTLDGETVTELRPVIGYLHTGIEKNMEFRTWTQGSHVLHPDGLPVPAVQRGRLLPGRGEAARHHRPDPRAGHRSSGCC